MPSDSVWVEFEEVKQNKFQLIWLRASKCTWEVSRARQKLELLTALQTITMQRHARAQSRVRVIAIDVKCYNIILPQHETLPCVLVSAAILNVFY